MARIAIFFSKNCRAHSCKGESKLETPVVFVITDENLPDSPVTFTKKSSEYRLILLH